MDSMVEVYLNRSFNEINAAEILFKISCDNEKKEESKTQSLKRLKS